MGKNLRLVVLACIAAIWLAPTYLLVVNALKPGASFMTEHAWDIPDSLGLGSNLARASQDVDFVATIVPTLLYSVVSPIIGTILGAMAGYAMVVLKVKRATVWFSIIFGASIFPAQMLLVPLFIGYAKVDLYDRHLGLILVHVALVVPFATLVMRNFFVGVSPALFEAAQIDGVSTTQAFLRIYLPIASTAIGAIFVLQATIAWNDFLFGLTLSFSDGVRPIIPQLVVLSGSGGATIPVFLSAALLASLPTVGLYLMSRRLFREGLTLGHF